ncbi:MAG: amidohydrolase, partial [Erysipelotrichaceae bacterium]|nr:amidohydrolase [Erysipelotrichaceae bacterium]
MLFKNGNLWMPEGQFKNMDLQTDNGKITAISESIEPAENEAVIDLKGLNVYPGMVEA